MKRKHPHHLLAIASAGVCALALLAHTLGIAAGGVPASEAGMSAIAAVPTETTNLLQATAVAPDAGAGIVVQSRPADGLAYTAASVALAAAGPLVEEAGNLATATPAVEPTSAPSTALRAAEATLPAPVAAALPAVDVAPAADATATPAQPVALPVAPNGGASLNGLAIEQIVVVPDAVSEHVGAIYARGQALGRDPRAFAKVGDSTMVYPPLLAAFDQQGAFELGPFGGAQPVIDRFAGSFARSSTAVRKGMHSWSQFDPEWADPARCPNGEGPLACELRLQNPSIAIIRLGANDTPEPGLFEEHMRRIIQTCLEGGVVPVLGTKPDRLEGPENTINRIVYRLAHEYQVPLWDYDLIAGTVPGKGLDLDQVHFLGGGPRDYSVPAAYAYADSLEDLTALLMLDVLSRQMQLP